jgi:hypothetical protein
MVMLGHYYYSNHEYMDMMKAWHGMAGQPLSMPMPCTEQEQVLGTHSLAKDTSFHPPTTTHTRKQRLERLPVPITASAGIRALRQMIPFTVLWMGSGKSK